MRSITRKMKRRRLIRLGLGIALIVGLAALIALWLAFQHKPGWYQPPVVNEVMLQRARTTSAATADRVSQQIVDGEAFHVTLTDESVNEWLAALPHLWPDARRSIPPEISDVAVGFKRGRIHVGGLYAKDDWRAILNVALAVAISPDGREVTLTLTDVQGGSLPVPRMIVDEILQRVRPHSISAGQDRNPHPPHGGSG